MNKTKRLTIASMFLAIGIILPQAFHVIPNAGNIILPMHIPVLICGFLCGPIYGLIVGLLTPVVSHLIFSMPPVIMLGQMIVELSLYGLLTGIFNKYLNISNEILKNYLSLVFSMLIARIVYGVFNSLLFRAGSYSLTIWVSSAFITALPGIVIQLLIIPVLVKTLNKFMN